MGVSSELASKIFDDLSKRTALLIGAGETGELTARHLMGRSIGRLIIANRTRRNAEALAAALGGEVVDFERLTEALPLADILSLFTVPGVPFPRARMVVLIGLVTWAGGL